MLLLLLLPYYYYYYYYCCYYYYHYYYWFYYYLTTVCSQDICIQNVASNLNEIIKLPIDLSCISERLINRIAAITPSRMLADTRDKKDKILTKLYKRRVGTKQ